jgi:hypothetical protein
MRAITGAVRAVAEAADAGRIAPLGVAAATVLGAVAMPLIELIAGGPEQSSAS